MGLTMDQFWDMTPYELKIASQAHAKKEKQTMRKLAWISVNIINTMIGLHGDKKSKSHTVTIDELLGDRVSSAQFKSVEELEAYMKKLEIEAEKQRAKKDL